jgi:hypothetical protein
MQLCMRMAGHTDWRPPALTAEEREKRAAEKIMRVISDPRCPPGAHGPAAPARPRARRASASARTSGHTCLSSLRPPPLPPRGLRPIGGRRAAERMAQLDRLYKTCAPPGGFEAWNEQRVPTPPRRLRARHRAARGLSLARRRACLARRRERSGPCGRRKGASCRGARSAGGSGHGREAHAGDRGRGRCGALGVALALRGAGRGVAGRGARRHQDAAGRGCRGRRVRGAWKL